jgi:hypothetical protein
MVDSMAATAVGFMAAVALAVVAPTVVVAGIAKQVSRCT